MKEPLGPNQGRGVASGFWFNIGGESSAACHINEDGTAVVAVGFVTNRMLELIGAAVLALSLLALAVVTVGAARRAVRSSAARGLLNASSLCLVLTMVMAVLHALSRWSGHVYVTIPTMARWHGVANALGYATCGMVAWAVADGEIDAADVTAEARSAEPGPPRGGDPSAASSPSGR